MDSATQRAILRRLSLEQREAVAINEAANLGAEYDQIMDQKKIILQQIEKLEQQIEKLEQAASSLDSKAVDIQRRQNRINRELSYKKEVEKFKDKPFYVKIIAGDGHSYGCDVAPPRFTLINHYYPSNERLLSFYSNHGVRIIFKSFDDAKDFHEELKKQGVDATLSEWSPQTEVWFYFGSIEEKEIWKKVFVALLNLQIKIDDNIYQEIRCALPRLPSLEEIRQLELANASAAAPAITTITYPDKLIGNNKAIAGQQAAVAPPSVTEEPSKGMLSKLNK